MKNALIGIIFSKDRTLQLEGTLRSLYRHCQDYFSFPVKVIYTASTSYHYHLYERLKTQYPQVQFIRETHFKYDLLKILLRYSHVLFLVDDNIFVAPFRVERILAALDQQPQALGFSLRLGKNTTYCYPQSCSQNLPEFHPLEDGLCAFDWTRAELDFHYPLDVSSSIYRLKDLLPVLQTSAFVHPNSLEGNLDLCKERFREEKPRLLCFERSVAFAAPLNMTQTSHQNRAGQKAGYGVEALARLYKAGQLMDVAAFDGFLPTGCHQEVEIAFKPAVLVAPVVSVIIACHNYGQYLGEAVESVLSQSYRNFEIWILDDSSTDETPQVAAHYIQTVTDVSIRYLRLEGDRGPTAARTVGIAHSQSRYLLFLDADDRLAPEYLKSTVALLDQNPAAGYVYVDVITFGSESRLYRQFEYDFKHLQHSNYFAYCSLIRRQAYLESGGYDAENWGYSEDWDLWLTLGEHGWHPVHLPQVLFYYHIHPSLSSFSSSGSKLQEYVRAYLCSRHSQVYPAEQARAARQLLAELPSGWHALPRVKLAAVLERSALLPAVPAVAEVSPGLEASIKTTVFILTIGDPAFEACNRAIQKQDARQFNIEYVAGIRPFSAAHQQMIDRCKTSYFIQVDEDMLLYPFAVRKMQALMEAVPEQVGMICFLLYDEDRRQKIQGVKIWRTRTLQALKMRSLLAADMDPLEQMHQAGSAWVTCDDVMGKHGVVYTPETIYRRYKSMYENAIGVWNVITPDLRTKLQLYRQTGDPLQLFAALGAVHGILNGPLSSSTEVKDFSTYQYRALEVFERLFLELPPATMEYDPLREPHTFLSQPLRLEDVSPRWKKPVSLQATWLKLRSRLGRKLRRWKTYLEYRWALMRLPLRRSDLS